MAKKKLSPFEQAYADARRRWTSGQGGATFSFGGKSYSVASREEAARQKAMMQSPTRGRGYNRAEVPAPKSSAGIPGAGPYKAPAASGGVDTSEIRRNLQNIVMAIPAARAVGMVGKAVQAATAARAAARAAPAAKRVDPLLYTSRTQGTGQFRAASGLAEKGKQATPDKMDRVPAFKQGGLVTKKR